MDIGINIIGADYDQHFPTPHMVDYYAAKGFSDIRLTLEWEKVQPSLNGELDKAYIEKIRALVEYADSVGVDVILDIHNYGAYNDKLIGSADVPVSAFADLWGKLGKAFAAQDNASFGLMNEPQIESATQWMPAVNAAIAAIRGAGATQQILVSGTYWDGAQSWTTTDNAKVIGTPGAVVDPAHNIAFEVHLYMDDTSGQNDWVVSETIGVERLEAVTVWARANGATLYLGEFGVADNPKALAALGNVMDFLAANADVWQGAAYWAGGTAWQEYMFSVEPQLGFIDAAQMDVLERYTGASIQRAVQKDGAVRVETQAADKAAPSMVDMLDRKGNLLSRAIVDADGNVSRKIELHTDKTALVTIFDPAIPGGMATQISYDAAHRLDSRTEWKADGSSLTIDFGENEYTRLSETTRDAKGVVTETVTHGAAGHVGTSYQNGVIKSVHAYDAAWQLMQQDSYDGAGHLVSRMTKSADGGSHIETFDPATGALKSAADYDANWRTTSWTDYDSRGKPQTTSYYGADGKLSVDHYDMASGGVARIDHFSADGKLESRATTQADGSHQIEQFANGRADHAVKVEVYDAQWAMRSQTLYDAEGHKTEVTTVQADGSRLIATYAGGKYPASVDLYDVNWQIVSRTQYDVGGVKQSVDTALKDGWHEIGTYAANGLLTQQDVYSANWQLRSSTAFAADGTVASTRVEQADGSRLIANYAAGKADHPATIDIYDATWQMVSRSHYGDAGFGKLADSMLAGGANCMDGRRAWVDIHDDTVAGQPDATGGGYVVATRDTAHHDPFNALLHDDLVLM